MAHFHKNSTWERAHAPRTVAACESVGGQRGNSSSLQITRTTVGTPANTHRLPPPISPGHILAEDKKPDRQSKHNTTDPRVD